MGSYQRRKGHNYEREVARKLRELLPDADVRRGRQTRRGDDEADVEGTPFWIECKVGAAPNVWAALKQADAARDHRPVAAFIKRNSTGGGKSAEEFVAVRREVFEALFEVAGVISGLDEETFGPGLSWTGYAAISRLRALLGGAP